MIVNVNNNSKKTIIINYIYLYRPTLYNVYRFNIRFPIKAGTTVHAGQLPQ